MIQNMKDYMYFFDCSNNIRFRHANIGVNIQIIFGLGELCATYEQYQRVLPYEACRGTGSTRQRESFAPPFEKMNVDGRKRDE